MLNLIVKAHTKALVVAHAAIAIMEDATADIQDMRATPAESLKDEIGKRGSKPDNNGNNCF